MRVKDLDDGTTSSVTDADALASTLTTLPERIERAAQRAAARRLIRRSSPRLGSFSTPPADKRGSTPSSTSTADAGTSTPLPDPLAALYDFRSMARRGTAGASPSTHHGVDAPPTGGSNLAPTSIACSAPHKPPTRDQTQDQGGGGSPSSSPSALLPPSARQSTVKRLVHKALAIARAAVGADEAGSRTQALGQYQQAIHYIGLAMHVQRDEEVIDAEELARYKRVYTERLETLRRSPSGVAHAKKCEGGDRRGSAVRPQTPDLRPQTPDVRAGEPSSACAAPLPPTTPQGWLSALLFGWNTSAALPEPPPPPPAEPTSPLASLGAPADPLAALYSFPRGAMGCGSEGGGTPATPAVPSGCWQSPELTAGAWSVDGESWLAPFGICEQVAQVRRLSAVLTPGSDASTTDSGTTGRCETGRCRRDAPSSHGHASCRASRRLSHAEAGLKFFLALRAAEQNRIAAEESLDDTLAMLASEADDPDVTGDEVLDNAALRIQGYARARLARREVWYLQTLCRVILLMSV